MTCWLASQSASDTVREHDSVFRLRCNTSLVGVLGQEAIDDHSITASSARKTSDGSCGSSNARLGTYAAWCPARNRNTEWIQWDFGAEVLISSVTTNGRPEESKDWVTTYKVLYSIDRSTWITYPQTFTGNSDAVNPMTNEFVPEVIVANSVRIQPLKWKNNIALQANFYGCEIHPKCCLCSGGTARCSVDGECDCNSTRGRGRGSASVAAEAEAVGSCATNPTSHHSANVACKDYFRDHPPEGESKRKRGRERSRGSRGMRKASGEKADSSTEDRIEESTAA